MRRALCWALLLLPLAGAAAAELRVRDDAGRELVLAAPARRVVALAPSLVEILYHIGAGDRLVGASAFSDFPPVAARLPRVADHAGVNLERLLELAPDLVVAWGSGNGAEAIARLERLGLVVFVAEPRGLGDLPGLFERLGVLTGREVSGAARAEAFRARLARLEKYARRRPLRVFYQLWVEPLLTVNGEHFASDLLARCGGHNVFADARPLVPQVSVEAVLAADPEVILVPAFGAGEGERWLAFWRRWPTLAAVRSGRLYEVPADLLARASPRLLEGAERVCRLLDGARQP